ncbi:hypothetical protein DSO57_1016782 [Entomophthora muscae]|uniref:Uncharacterized protein n=1 Tax=Entomophthora muscae TaxID=34485 RepID=A0ACC2U326_9FUNG|nr:hypothetical protein DSO57_1016782 [Entomophthora muscae]
MNSASAYSSYQSFAHLSPAPKASKAVAGGRLSLAVLLKSAFNRDIENVTSEKFVTPVRTSTRDAAASSATYKPTSPLAQPPLNRQSYASGTKRKSCRDSDCDEELYRTSRLQDYIPSAFVMKSLITTSIVSAFTSASAGLWQPTKRHRVAHMS